MGNGIIDIRESEMIEMRSHLNKSHNNLDSFTSDFSSSFKNINSTGLLEKSTTKIGKQVSVISNQVSRMGQAVIKSYEDMLDTEMVLKGKAEEIKTPMDFYKNDSSKSVDTESIDLNKNDGQSINSNNDSNEKDLIFESVINYNDKLDKIVKDYEDINGEIDVKTNKTDLYNVMKDEVSINSEIDEYSVDEVILEKINKEVNEKNPEFNDSFEIDKLVINKLKNNNLKEVDYDDNYKLVKQLLSEDLNNGNFVLKNIKK